MEIDIDELLDKSYNGRIQPEELAEVLDRIQKYYEHPNNNDDIHSLLQIVGYAGAFSHDCDVNECKKLIEKFIIFPQDPFVSVTALDVLCNDWDLTAEIYQSDKTIHKGSGMG